MKVIDPEYNEKIMLSEVLDDLKEIQKLKDLKDLKEVQKRIGLLIEKIKKFIPSGNPEKDNFDDLNLHLDRVIKKYGFPYLT